VSEPFDRSVQLSYDFGEAQPDRENRPQSIIGGAFHRDQRVGMVWSERAVFALECFPNDPFGLGILALVSESLSQVPFCDEI
jgi:hypothetical protein